jgi:UDP-N-acetylmuramoyl-tripeptide--D-alanyl-D-alanine ligase
MAGLRFAGRTVTFDSIGRPTCRRRTSNRAASAAPPTSRRRKTVRLETPLVGRGNLANVLAGLAVGLDAGVPLDAMAARAATLTPPSHRGEVRELASGVTVIDDAYNANPLAVERALDVLGAETGAGRRVAVLGEMLELGPESAALHARVGRAVARTGVALLVTVGGDPARALGRGAQDAGSPRTPSATPRRATRRRIVAGLVRPGDLVLVKARAASASSASSIAWRKAR